MADDPTQPSNEGASNEGAFNEGPSSGDTPGAGREALMVWVKMFGLIAGLGLFCLVIFRLTRMLA